MTHPAKSERFGLYGCSIFLHANSLLIYGDIFAHFLIHWEALPHKWLCTRSHLNFLIQYISKILFSFLSVFWSMIFSSTQVIRCCKTRVISDKKLPPHNYHNFNVNVVCYFFLLKYNSVGNIRIFGNFVNGSVRSLFSYSLSVV